VEKRPVSVGKRSGCGKEKGKNPLPFTTTEGGGRRESVGLEKKGFEKAEGGRWETKKLPSPPKFQKVAAFLL